MKKMPFILLILGLLMIASGIKAADEPVTEILLPEPETEIGMPLMQALEERRSVREFGPRRINDQNLSELLWAANGVNREDGRRTIPTSRDSRDLSVYVLRQGGAYYYNPVKNRLELVNPAALRYTGFQQDYVKNADTVLIYVSKNPNREKGAMHAGSAYQNVGLYCAAAGMNNVVIGMIDRQVLHKELNLKDNQYVVIAQALGWPKKK